MAVTVDGFELTPHVQDTLAQLAEAETTLEKKALRILQIVGDQTIAYLRSHTGELRPPVGARIMQNKGGVTRTYVPPRGRREGPRKAHPGHWADDVGSLAGAYRYELQELDGTVRLTLINDMEYAAELEKRDGYFVLAGVTDPGGPVEKALRQALTHFPELELKL